MAKYAVVIGVSEYPEATGDGGLKPLLRATKDAEAVAEVLQDVDMGDFDEVELLTNPDKTVIETTIEQIFSTRRSKQDVVVLYFSGHGIKDFRSGHLFLTAHNTAKSDGGLVKATAVSAIAIHGFLNDCPSKHQVIILDCCYSGAFAEGLNAKDGGRQLDLKNEFGGEGRAILTSSSSVELSYEREEGELSVYTDYLLEGIRTGSADKDEDGWISVDEAHSYAKQRVKSEANGMNPKIYSSDEGYKIYLVKAPATMALKRYRETVEKCVKTGKGQITFICRETLSLVRVQSGISETDAQQIERSILVPLQRRKENLEKYRKALSFALNESNPISENHRIELQDLQEHLDLNDEIVQILEKQLCMTDLEKIQQLEQEIGKKLQQISLDKITGSDNGYAVDENNNVIGLNLDESELATIPNALINMKNLQKLSIVGNKIEKLPAAFGQLQNLSKLRLYENQLKELPASVGQLQNLSSLGLSRNQLKELPASVGQLQNLSSLGLSRNQLTELPASFGQLQNLSDLELQHNQLKELPASFGQLQNLSVLGLGKNQLKELPASFGQLQNLSSLDLSNNQLKELPAWFGQLQNLSLLYLYENQLKELPASMGQLQNLSYLRLENNQLKELPVWLRQLQNLRQLYISGNPLETPPMEIAEKGIEAIREYFEKQD
ncbi:leucine-rich repeat domain-containing protein [Candidatus Albibeggiatoa sp. nov. BB20]|uniref:caspase, EACC1-associated type n=1 Tax=Candidatus Albibeggiatoa sp. nov. BB20 TaxID=3162723 RepID=UPI00336570B6